MLPIMIVLLTEQINFISKCPGTAYHLSKQRIFITNEVNNVSGIADNHLNEEGK